MTAPAKAAPMREDVTQADRDAAAAFCGRPHFRNGTDYDHNPLVQAFARHRTSTALALAQPAAVDGEGLDAAADEYLAEYVMTTEGNDYVPTEWERELIEDALHGFIAEHFAALAPAAIASGREGAE